MLRREISFGLLAAAGTSAFVKEAHAQSCTPPCYAQTAAELAAGVTPVNYSYPPGNVLRYGTNSNPGTTDMTTAIQNSLSQAAQATGVSAYLPAGTYLVEGQLTMLSNTRLYGDGSSSLINFSSTANQDSLIGAGVTNCLVCDIKCAITGSVISGTLYAGVIAFRNSSENVGSQYCKVERVEISGAYYSGVVIVGDHNTVRGCYIHNANAGAYQDASDIHIDCTGDVGSSYNIIDANQCFGGGNSHGISLLASANPNFGMTRNLVSYNRIGAHTAYGILLYTHTHGDTWNEVIGNEIDGITGASTFQGGSAGAGIYVAGMSAVSIVSNTVYNCLSQTSNSTLAPGGIGIVAPSNGSSITITGNSIYDLAQGNASGATIAGIYIGDAPLGTTITGNTVSQQNGEGLTAGIFVTSGNSGLTISGNNINILNTLSSVQQTRGIMLHTASSNTQNVTISGNTVIGCSAYGISLEADTAGYGVAVFTISGNVVSGGASTTVPIYISGAEYGSVTGNSCNAAGTHALVLDSAWGVRCSANLLYSSGSQTISASGTCTGSFVDESNSVNGAIVNAGSGCNMRQLGSTTAAFTTAQPGDVVYNTAGSTPFAWQYSGSAWVGLALP